MTAAVWLLQQRKLSLKINSATFLKQDILEISLLLLFPCLIFSGQAQLQRIQRRYCEDCNLKGLVISNKVCVSKSHSCFWIDFRECFLSFRLFHVSTLEDLANARL